MKRKVFSVLIALVLVLSFSLMTAVPAGAENPGDVEFGTAGDGVAELTTEEAHSGSYSVKFHTDTFDWTYKYAMGIPVDDIPLNEITELSYWRNGVGFEGKGFVDYVPPAVILCIDANNDGKLDFGTDVALSEDSSLMGDDAILEIGSDWIETDVGWLKVDGLHNSYWAWGGACWIDKNGWSGWVGYSSLEEVIAAGGFNPSDAGFPCPIDPTDHVMLVVIAGGNPDGDLYVDDITINGVLYELEPPPTIEVNIDIKPGSDPNSINLKSKGVMPVAILTTEAFDANAVDPETMEFAGAEPLRSTMEDVDGDGDLDMLFHFKTQELDLDEDSTEATLTGKTLDGIDIVGTDTVNIVPKDKVPK